MAQEIIEKKRYIKTNKAIRIGRNCVLVYWGCWYKSVNKS